jgi:hypothetical protein
VTFTHLVEQLCFILQGLKAVCHAGREIEGPTVFGRQLKAIPLAIGARVRPKIDSDIEDCASHASDQLRLAVRSGLIVQSPQSVTADVVRGAALDDFGSDPPSSEFVCVEHTRKPAPFVGYRLRLDEPGSWDYRGSEAHP